MFWILQDITIRILKPIVDTIMGIQGYTEEIAKVVRDIELLQNGLIEDFHVEHSSALSENFLEETISAESYFKLGHFMISSSSVKKVLLASSPDDRRTSQGLTSEEIKKVYHFFAGLILSTLTRLAEVRLFVLENPSVISQKALPTRPLDYFTMSDEQFTDLLEIHTQRLLVTKIPDFINSTLVNEFRDLRNYIRLHSDKERIVSKLVDEQDKGFFNAWKPLSNRFSNLRLLACGFATLYPTTAQFESDFFKLKGIKGLFRHSLADLSIEGILHSKQFDVLIEYHKFLAGHQ